MKNLISIALCFLLTFPAIAKSTKMSSRELAAKGVIERTLGYWPKNLVLSVTGPCEDGQEYFSTEVIKGRLHIEGSSTVALCRGFYDYVKSNGYGLVTWSVNTISLPEQLPDQARKIVVTPFQHRQYMNVCTLGYTMPYWKWENWQKELDWMALHGFDMPLSPIGSEAIFARVWRKLGLTEEEIGEFVTGGAHFPWFRMGNMSRLDGNLPQSYYDQSIELEHKIVDRMNELGMSPIYNAFAGFVPERIKRLYPETELIKTGWGDGEYYVSNFISPETDLYRKISVMYINEWENEFGKGKYYLADSFNEMDIPFAAKGTPERFGQISSYGKELYASIKEANPDAVWVIQGWMFGYQRHIWDPESIRALFSAVPDDKMLLLDLSVDFNYGIWQNEYTWNYAPKLYGKNWLYSTVPNFGGRNAPVGDLEFYLNGHLKALGSINKGNLVGYGTAPEGVENNEVTYEAIADAAWSLVHKDIDEWLKSYSVARYGKYPEAMDTFWTKMLESSNKICSSRAQYRIQKRPFDLLGGRYDTSNEHFEAIEAFISCSDELGDNQAYRTDLAYWAGIYAFGKADILVEQINDCYLHGDTAGAEKLEADFRKLMLMADSFLESNPISRLERWTDFAKSWGTTPEESGKYETNARRLVTIWGPGKGPDGLDDYACRIWSGLIRDYYLPRWENYFASRKSGKPFDFNGWEYKFAEERKPLSPATPYTDICSAARSLVEYSSHVAREEDYTTLPGCSSFNFNDGTTRLIYFVTPEVLNKVKGLKFTYLSGEDNVNLKKIQINVAGWVRTIKDTDIVIGKDNPSVEVELDVRPDGKRYEFNYMHITFEGTKKLQDSNMSIEWILQ
ncbi:MAG: alpha-N-acetylglucosaminidase [Bacteroidales bacterium]|nr:alpha-N-acetylglucosaminidase [Bacteroidales bacterium]